MNPPHPAVFAFDHVELTDLGVLAVRGPDARRFLNGQLSQDVLALAAERVALAGLHTAQGRVLAVLRLVADGQSDVLCILPRELLEPTRSTLGKYLLRAKAALTDESDRWRITGLARDPVVTGSAIGSTLGMEMGAARIERAEDGSLARIFWRHADDGRVLLLQRATHVPASAITTDDPAAREAWRLADIEAELPQVYATTSGEFVAQMLNLDRFGGISFTKGCYTGQEVIARAHYLGKVKRRAQRFVLPVDDSSAPLRPGASLTLPDGRSAQLVDAAGQQVLAVTTVTET